MDIPSSLPTARPAPLPDGTVIAAWLGSASALLTSVVILLSHIG